MHPAINEVKDDKGGCRCRDAVATTEQGPTCVPPLQAGHRSFTLFVEGDELYEAMLADIAMARARIRMESYVLAADEIGWRFARALAERATAGVEVRLHLDAMGFLLWGNRKLKTWLRDQGIRLRLFHRWRWREPLRYNRRHHRKLLVVDEAVVYVGGFNIHRESSRFAFGAERWRDTHVRLGGAVARSATRLFDDFWNGRRRRPITEQGTVNVLVPNVNRTCRQALHCLYADSFRSAHRSIYLTTPYFVPDHRSQRQLRQAAQRGVDVRLLVPRKSDNLLVQWAARAAYAKLLDAGVCIYEYLPRMLHAKTAVVDGTWGTVGTANLDYRSFFMNHEINLVSRDPRLCQRLEAQFMVDLDEAEQIIGRQWARRPWSQHVVEVIGWLARRWL
ncbi:MAG: phospholipase D-like domain-containing protein [Gammaproteobacteria bacterium]|nr:MAG: phospholipase D-like domain-containing protein [Gammaproteobacteria bacterium]